MLKIDYLWIVVQVPLSYQYVFRNSIGKSAALHEYSLFSQILSFFKTSRESTVESELMINSIQSKDLILNVSLL